MTSRRKQKKSYSILAAWGEPGVPLLPESLRLAWANDLLPNWVIAETGLPEGSTMATLDSRVWGSGLESCGPRLCNFVVNLVHSRRREIEPLHVFVRSWPASLPPLLLPWRTRTRNCLEKSGLLEDRLALSNLTYKDLLELPAMGILSALDFASTVEAAMDQLDVVGDLSPLQLEFENIEPEGRSQESPRHDLRDRLLKVIDAGWAPQVSEHDPRFIDLLPDGEGTVFERIDVYTSSPADHQLEEQSLAEAIPAIEARIQEIDSLPLDVALQDFLAAVSGYSGKKLEALLARLGWGGQEPITLEEAGRIAGITRERVRQLLKRIENRMPDHPVYMPALDSAIHILASRAPINAEPAAQLLVTLGISSKPFSPVSILATAKGCGREVPFWIQEHRGRLIVATGSHGQHANAVLAIAHRQAIASGAANTAEVAAEALSDGISISEEQIRETLQIFPDVQFLEDHWLWYPKGRRGWNPICRYARKMLSVVSPISVTAIREGLRREYRYRSSQKPRKWDLTVPPRSVLRHFFSVHPEFGLNELDQVTPVMPLDYRTELSATEQILVDVIRSSPTCVFDRSSYALRCIDRGMNQHTFSVYLTYSAVIAHVSTDIWTLRGLQVDPGVVEALRAANAEQPREKRVLDYSWTPEGRLWVGVRLPDLKSRTSFIFLMPSAIRHLVADSEFSAFSESSLPSGRIRVTEDGQSWGYGPFLARSGADEGDILMIKFDLAEHSAVLQLGDEEVLEKLSS
jgi:sigma-70-like protein